MLSDKMEFSITLWNIWSVLPLTGKAPPRSAVLENAAHWDFPPSLAGTGSRSFKPMLKLPRPPPLPTEAPLSPCSNSCTGTRWVLLDWAWRKSSTYCSEIGQDTKGTPEFLHTLQQPSPANMKPRWHPADASKSFHTNPLQSSAEGNVTKKWRTNTSTNKQTINQQPSNCGRWSSAQCPHS